MYTLKAIILAPCPSESPVGFSLPVLSLARSLILAPKKKRCAFSWPPFSIHQNILHLKTTLMRSLLMLSLAFLFSFTTAPKADVPSTEEATIYIYRAGQFNAATSNWAMYVDGKKICKLSNNKFIKVTVSKGKHSITSQIGGVGLFKKETEIEIDAEAGQSYYVACNVKQSFTRSRLEMLEVTKSTADKQMKEMSLDNCQEKIDEEANK